MSLQFDWQEGDDEPSPSHSSLATWQPSGTGGFLLALMLVLALLLIWLVATRRQDAQEAELKTLLTRVLQLEQQALAQNDYDLFFSTQVPDPAWRSIQLRPAQQAFNRQERTIVEVGQHGLEAWANVTWAQDGHTYQRLLYFENDTQLRRAPQAKNYWQGQTRGKSFQYEWGTISLFEKDMLWRDAFDQFMTQLLQTHCPQKCRQQHLPLTIHVTPTMTDLPLATEIYIPSPRLIALDEAGDPAQPFWQQLEAQLLDYLMPATTIQFALPNNHPYYRASDLRGLASQFMAQHPSIHVEISIVDGEASPQTWLEDVDAAAIAPTQALIEVGAIRDLTPFVQGDILFDEQDFYDQIWQGVYWQDRVWAVPQSASMNLLFYDLTLFRNAGIPLPQNPITWTELDDIFIQLANYANTQGYSAIFLDAGHDSLYAYALNWQHPCPKAPCLSELSSTNISAAFTWYNNLVDNKMIVDLSHLSPKERELLAFRHTTAFRQVGVWVSPPINYEYQRTLSPIGVLSFPSSSSDSSGVSDSAGISPLHLHGFVTSQSATNLYWTWQWLSFLSQQAPIARFRYIPARSSVAQRTNYWGILPAALRIPMQQAFPQAQAILIGDENIFMWETLSR